MYNENRTADEVDEAKPLDKSYDAIAPTRSSLAQHVKRDTYLAACIWGQATICPMHSESPAYWGWSQEGEIRHVVWTTLRPIAQSCPQLTKRLNVVEDANAH